MRSYEAARGLFSFLGFCSWVVIIVGALGTFIGGTAVGSNFGNGPNPGQVLLAAAPGLFVVLLGIFGLAIVQMGRAGVDTAEYSQQSLDIARRQLETAQQALAQGTQLVASYAMTEGATRNQSPLEKPEESKDSSQHSYASHKPDIVVPKQPEATPDEVPKYISYRTPFAAPTLPEPTEQPVAEILKTASTPDAALVVAEVVEDDEDSTQHFQLHRS